MATLQIVHYIVCLTCSVALSSELSVHWATAGKPFMSKLEIGEPPFRINVCSKSNAICAKKLNFLFFSDEIIDAKTGDTLIL